MSEEGLKMEDDIIRCPWCKDDFALTMSINRREIGMYRKHNVWHIYNIYMCHNCHNPLNLEWKMVSAKKYTGISETQKLLGKDSIKDLEKCMVGGGTLDTNQQRNEKPKKGWKFW